MLHLISTTDLHGHIPNNLVDHLLNYSSNQTIFLDNGDYFLGSPLCTYLALEQPEYLIDKANQLQFDAMVLGNHDLDISLDWLKDQVSKLNCPYLCANLTDLDGNLIFEPYTILNKSGLNIAIIGLLTAAYPSLANSKDHLNYRVKDCFETLGELIPNLCHKVDMVILAYHGGLTRDINSGQAFTYPSLEDQAYELFEAFPQLSACICGHQHFARAGLTAFNRPIIQPGSHGHFLGHQSFDVCQGQVTFIGQDLLPLQGKGTMEKEVQDNFLCWQTKKIERRDLEAFIQSIYTNMSPFVDLPEIVDIGAAYKYFQPPFWLNHYQLTIKEWQDWLQNEGLSNELIRWKPTDDGIINIISARQNRWQDRLKTGFLFPVIDQFLLNKRFLQ